MPCICLLGLLVSSSFGAAVAEFAFDIPATTLDKALARFTEQSGNSVGMTGTLPRLRTPQVAGRFTPQQALQRLLSGSGFVAVPLGSDAFRLEPREQVQADGDAARDSAALADLDEVVVTATKRSQDFRTLPLSMTVVSGKDIDAGLVPGGSRAAHRHDVTTSSTNLGPGRERQFIRGIADSPFLGPSQATVTVQFDDARATYDAPDPDLVLLDVEQVEILKGPQGPLYGTGALGGVFHIVPRHPDLNQADWQGGMQWQQVDYGGAGFGADLVVNLPLVAGRAGLRGVMYANSEPGWIDNAGGRENANDTRIRGGRLALRMLLSSGWTLDLQGVAQNSKTADSQYVIDTHDLSRSGVLPEPHDSDFYLGVATAQGRWLGHNVLLTTSLASHESDGMLDASAAAREVVHLEQQAGEAAVFGEASSALSRAWHATAGLRVFRNEMQNDGRAALLAKGDKDASWSITPSFSVDWRNLDERRFVYLRYARAVRPGGLNLADSSQLRRFESDNLSNVDLGARLLLWDEALSIDSTLFATRWTHIQSDYLLTNGLVGTRNVGAGEILGVESSLHWVMDDSWRVEGAITLQHARLNDSAVVADEADHRLPVVPDVRVRASLLRALSLGDWRIRLRGDVNYVGSSRLSFEPALDRRMGNYVRTDVALQLQRGALSWTLQLDNLFDSRADTFAFGNPFSIRSQSQFTPLKPRTLTLGLSYSPAR